MSRSTALIDGTGPVSGNGRPQGVGLHRLVTGYHDRRGTETVNREPGSVPSPGRVKRFPVFRDPRSEYPPPSLVMTHPYCLHHVREYDCNSRIVHPGTTRSTRKTPGSFLSLGVVRGTSRLVYTPYVLVSSNLLLWIVFQFHRDWN